MCGIAGLFGVELAPEQYQVALGRMTDSIRHRGPDQDGVLAVPTLGAGLGSRRLSLVDLEGGRQPIANEDGSVHVVLDGEIYNHVELRKSLERRGHRFRTRCDTETIVHLYEDFGIECLNRLEGMFALAILDVPREKLLLARDGAGMKRLYWARTDHGFVFGSEIKALLASGLIDAEPDWSAVAAYSAIGYVPSPRTGFAGIQKLAPGSWLAVTTKTHEEGTFWLPRFTRGPRRSEAEYAAELSDLLDASVKSHLTADVEVGALLSGGLDSSLVTARAVACGHSVKTFSIVFPDDPDADESQYARLMAKKLGTDHREIEFRSSDLARLVPTVVRSLEEPFTRGPFVVRYQLAKLVSESVKAAVSGEGADELFAGYSWLRNPWFDAAETLRVVTPRPIARALVNLSGRDRWRQVWQVLGARTSADVAVLWLRQLGGAPNDFLKPEFCDADAVLTATLPHVETLASCRDPLARRLALEFVGRMGDGVLFACDKTTMAHSVEMRMPFLHRPLVEFALALPSSLKVRDGRVKYLLGQVAASLPETIRARQKQGLRHPRRFGADPEVRRFVRETLLDSRSAAPPIDRKVVESSLSAAFAREDGRMPGLWSAAVLQCWWNEFFA